MKKLLFVCLLMLVGTGANAAVAPVLSQSFEYGGHYYEFYRNNNGGQAASISWTEANGFAVNQEIDRDGVTYQGHLATITSAGENDFIVGQESHERSWLGGIKVDNSWTWVTGESWGEYTNWLDAPAQPSGNGNYLWFWRDMAWDDTSNGDSLATGFIVEYDTVSAVPVPGAIWLFGPGLALLAGVRRRQGERLS